MFSFEELVTICDATILKSPKPNLNKTFTITTDTRNIRRNDIFLPLKGPNFDGHDFIEQAVCKRSIPYFTSERKKIFDKSPFVLYVPDVKHAYLKLARSYKNRINPIVIAITGSSGKTTTKEMMYNIVNTTLKTHKSYLNHNNEIGFCETMLSMEKDTEVVVVEMGMRGLGEIDEIADIAKPDITIITNIGLAHIGKLGSQENIAKAKCEALKHTHNEGLCILPKTDLVLPYLNSCKANIEFVDLNYSNVTILSQDEYITKFLFDDFEYEINCCGDYNVDNAIKTITAAKYLNITEENIYNGLKNYVPLECRFVREKVGNYEFINDCYNANPESMEASIVTFCKVFRGKKVLILGDMLELGRDEVLYHQRLGEFLNKFTKDVDVITIGNLSEHIQDRYNGKILHFENIDDCVKYISNSCEKEENEGIRFLLKASNSMNFGKIIERLQVK